MLKRILGSFTFAAGIIGICATVAAFVAYQFKHPWLTQMQVAMQLSPLYVCLVVALGLLFVGTRWAEWR